MCGRTSTAFGAIERRKSNGLMSYSERDASNTIRERLSRAS